MLDDVGGLIDETLTDAVVDAELSLLASMLTSAKPDLVGTVTFVIHWLNIAFSSQSGRTSPAA